MSKKQTEFEHQEVLQKILNLMPKLKGSNGRVKKLKAQDLKFYSIQAGKIFEAVVDYIIAQKGAFHIRNHVFMEKSTYDQLDRQLMARGGQIGAETVLKRFKEKSLWQRLRCAFSGHID